MPKNSNGEHPSISTSRFQYPMTEDVLKCAFGIQRTRVGKLPACVEKQESLPNKEDLGTDPKF